MKTRITFAVSILMVCLLPFSSSAQSSEKIYQVTEDGKHQFIYVKDYIAENGIVHPITPRTFYLETKRLGLISENVSYTSFLQYPAESVQAMIDLSQNEMIAALNNSSDDIVHQSVTIQPQSSHSAVSQQETSVEPDCIEIPDMNITGEEPADFTSPPTQELSWIAKAVTHPGTEAVPATFKESPKDTTYSQVRTKLPWVVQLMLMDGDMPYENWYDYENIPILTEAEAARRVRLHDLVQDLLAYQDDSIQREYGKIFPGMDGKLYGDSDAELDELVGALLNMKDEFLASSKPELHEIFSELQILAMGR